MLLDVDRRRRTVGAPSASTTSRSPPASTRRAACRRSGRVDRARRRRRPAATCPARRASSAWVRPRRRRTARISSAGSMASSISLCLCPPRCRPARSGRCHGGSRSHRRLPIEDPGEHPTDHSGASERVQATHPHRDRRRDDVRRPPTRSPPRRGLGEPLSPDQPTNGARVHRGLRLFRLCARETSPPTAPGCTARTRS